MPAPVRVRDNVTGHEFTTYAVDENDRVDEGLTVLKGEAAVDERTGVALPPKYPTKAPVVTAQAAAAVDPPTDAPIVDTDAKTAPDSLAANPPATAEGAATDPAAAAQSADASEEVASTKKATAARPAGSVTGPKATTPKEN